MESRVRPGFFSAKEKSRWQLSSSSKLLVVAAATASLVMLCAGLLPHPAALSVQRLSAGIVSAFIFICGGVLASRLGSPHPQRAGLIIGLYYGGTGIGIVLSAVLVPLAMSFAHDHRAAHAWQWAWMGLAAGVFGAVFLSVVASTTAMVRHNLPPDAWSAGISGFTTVFALGQIVGPSMGMDC